MIETESVDSYLPKYWEVTSLSFQTHNIDE